LQGAKRWDQLPLNITGQRYLFGYTRQQHDGPEGSNG